MARPPVRVSAAALDRVRAAAIRARHADERAAAEWAATYDTISQLIAARELTVAAAAEALAVSESTLNRSLAARRRDAHM